MAATLDPSDSVPTWFELGPDAIGAIQPGPGQQARLDELTQRIGQFYTVMPGSPAVVVRCVDGRIPAGGAGPLGPNSAGGTQSLAVADDLTAKRFASDDGSFLSLYQNILAVVSGAGHEIGGHTSDHAAGDASGCGANDKLTDIYRYIAQSGQVLQSLSQRLGVPVTDEMRDLIVANAAARTDFPRPRDLLEALQASANPDFVDNLAGEHREVLAVINGHAGTTLDRDALLAEYGSDYEVFNVDAWALEPSARLISAGPDETQQRVAAMVYYNLATTLVLGGPKMRIVTVS